MENLLLIVLANFGEETNIESLLQKIVFLLLFLISLLP